MIEKEEDRQRREMKDVLCIRCKQEYKIEKRNKKYLMNTKFLKECNRSIICEK